MVVEVVVALVVIVLGVGGVNEVFISDVLLGDGVGVFAFGAAVVAVVVDVDSACRGICTDSDSVALFFVEEVFRPFSMILWKEWNELKLALILPAVALAAMAVALAIFLFWSITLL